jgi:site-specific DNA-cytosine methylase
MNKKYTYASIVPLIGGENFGIMQAMNGQLPEYVLSYSAFTKNDAHFINHLRTKEGWQGDYVLLDVEGNENYKPAMQVDVVNAVCPCAGLSSLSTTSSADSAVNDWLYMTAEHVLKNIKPKVFWGENAPRLFTTAGKKVADKLYGIAKENGYTLNLYYTESRLHGLAQKRPRTFYFFTKGEETPIFKYYRRAMQPVDEILQMDTDPNDSMDKLINSEDPRENPWVAYCMHRAGAKTLKEYHDKIDKSTNCIVSSDQGKESLLEVADWMDANGFPARFGERARAMQGKLNDGKGYWAHGVTMPKGEIPSLIGAMPHSLINPYKDRFLTLRDCLRIMKMPENFEMVGDNPQSPGNANAICQNVPVTTAADMMANVIEYLEGRCDTVQASYVRQNNSSMKHEIIGEEAEIQSLDEFFNLHRTQTVV